MTKVKFISTWVFLFLANISFTQVTFVVNKFPADTVLTDIYISGDFERWTGGQKDYKLQQIKNHYFITLPQYEGTINFKFTKGTWETVETEKNFNQIENRQYTFNMPNDTVNIEIKNWSKGKVPNSTASENVKLFYKAMHIPQLKRKRRIWVYLPPDYETSKEKYPVLYMQDGQNLFDAATAFAGEWAVDETMNRLAKEKNLKMIVVGIDNGSKHRMDEYSPWKNKIYGGGKGDAYIKFIVETLKPKIDSSFRTKPQSKHTAIMGSSMGGLISYYGALKYPKTFGKVGVFSPSFWFSDKVIDFTKKQSKGTKVKAYFLMGSEEGNSAIEAMEKVVTTLKKSGYKKKNFIKKIVLGGKHNEALWRNEFEEAILWLFDK
ncbi:alpha/beta hydrolase-fold protein [Aureibaculum sp. 2210JD6-5]|uniref:alpha/beta hydrolase n=1 Tax=Aureibaculum sp. 2210JD6-5 TaxID=3103957 RepID=UPI002AADE16E|nr:alpha/beta hydrolase-fold protein [Aureibaculum sp. 2210JD6-5]MDY7394456.1 alpha/beta hydrolase-fold protein [Aureibaculum sp. 2210JD6-5]